MLNGHGDDIFRYDDIRINFSSNVYAHFDHRALYAYLATRMDCLAHYPEPSPERLERMLAEVYGTDAREVMVTAGATEAIYLTAQAYRRSRSAILQPTFSEYADACRIHEHRISNVFLHNASHSREDAWTPQGCEMVWTCCPDNPTGRVWPKDELLRLVAENPSTLFVVDASYAPYTEAPLISPRSAVEMPNLLILRSMTKEFAIPGLRLGYMIGRTEVLEPMRRMRMPWSVNQPAQDAGAWLLAHRDAYRLPLGEMMRERQRMSQALARLGIVEVWPSDSHILLCRLRIGDAAHLKDYLATEHGLLIRDASNFEGLDASYFRIAVQTPAEDDELIKGINEWMAH
ncbi:MAG: histidinol-phosphate aminotransferase family protein [Bacteroidaceae bacterium]|nr:histidinol-phosphate aminotransferase family protein [Bacteroidaceae bacterium]